MYTAKIREELENHIGKYATIRYNLGRNKYESYDVKIEKTFNHVFLVKLKDKEEVKTFTYTDIITKTVKINY